MHKSLDLWDDVDRLYVSRKGGGRGLSSIDDYIKRREGRLITATRNNRQHKYQQNKNGENKKLCGYFEQQTNEFSLEKTWTCLRGILRENESLFISAQNSVRTVKARINKTQQNCRLCW